MQFLLRGTVKGGGCMQSGERTTAAACSRASSVFPSLLGAKKEHSSSILKKRQAPGDPNTHPH